MAVAESLVTQLHTNVGQANKLVWELSARAPEGLNMTVAIPAVSFDTEPANSPQVRTETCGASHIVMQIVTGLQKTAGGIQKVGKGGIDASHEQATRDAAGGNGKTSRTKAGAQKKSKSNSQGVKQPADATHHAETTGKVKENNKDTSDVGCTRTLR